MKWISILIVAGESSGERYGAALIREFKKIRPDASFFGIGGTRMDAEGVDLLFRVEQLSVIGLFEVIAHIPRISGILSRVAAEARSRKPAAAVLIDSPDFNLRLAKKLKTMGIPVLYYISPTVWAWRKNRLKTIRKYVDRMMLIFPFEKKIYDEAHIPAVYLGHPLLERVSADTDRDRIFARYGLDPGKTPDRSSPRQQEGRNRLPRFRSRQSRENHRGEEACSIRPHSGGRPGHGRTGTPLQRSCHGYPGDRSRRLQPHGGFGSRHFRLRHGQSGDSSPGDSARRFLQDLPLSPTSPDGI